METTKSIALLMKCFQITISGKVQGVGFRYSARSMAHALGINGIVKNMSNGNVYIEAEGNDNVLKDFINWCNKKPRFLARLRRRAYGIRIRRTVVLAGSGMTWKASK